MFTIRFQNSYIYNIHVAKKKKPQSFVVAIQYIKYIKEKYNVEHFFLNNGCINKINAVWAVWEK